MEQCKLKNPHEEVYLKGHCFRRNHKKDSANNFYWDGEWYCVWCGEKTKQDLTDPKEY